MFRFSRTSARLRATYAGLAPFYDAVVPFVSSQARAMGRSWLAVQDGEHVLDVGTGTGLALQPLVAANPTGWTEGVDLTPALLQRARHRLSTTSHTRYGLRQADATALPYPTDTFDAVFSGYVLDVLPETQIRPALREIRRVLRPNGRIVIVSLAPPQHPVERVWETLARLAWPLLGGDRPIDSRSLLREENFTVTAHTTHRQAGLRSAITRATPHNNTARAQNAQRPTQNA